MRNAAVLGLLLSLAALAASTDDTEKGARAAFAAVLTPRPVAEGQIRALQPTLADCQSIGMGDRASAEFADYASLWKREDMFEYRFWGRPLLLRLNRLDTTKGTDDLKKGLVVYRYEVFATELDGGPLLNDVHLEDGGVLHLRDLLREDGGFPTVDTGALVFVNGHWAAFPTIL
jgi:hypothetical protein